jgi:hypothetical protein
VIELETAVRAYVDVPHNPKDRPRERSINLKPSYILVFDTETTTDASQQLNFGSYRYCRMAWAPEPRATCVEEGIFYSDELPVRDPQGFEALSRYCAENRADVSPDCDDDLKLISRKEFVDVIHAEAFKKRATLVAFNFPFDISRLSVAWSEARLAFRGGISLTLWQWDNEGTADENKYRPRIGIKHIDSKRALKGFTDCRDPDPVDLIPEGAEGGPPDPRYVFRGHFLDLRTLAFSLTDKSFSLASACEEFDVPHPKEKSKRHGVITLDYIEYNRSDVRASCELFEGLMEEYLKHPITLQPTKAYSPASIGKAYLKAAGVVPPLHRQPDFPKEVVGYAMTAYYGGRSECRIRRHPMPVVYLDFSSMYPTVNALMKLWSLVIADRIEVRDATEDVIQLLEGLNLQRVFDPDFWPGLCVLVELLPQGDILPVRARYQGLSSTNSGFQIGVNALSSNVPRWYALPDVVASCLLSRRVPKVLRALRLEPHGIQEGLRPVALRGEFSIDPRSEDLFQTLVKKRRALREEIAKERESERLRDFLKVLANATSYGIFAEIVREELPKRERVPATIYGLKERLNVRLPTPERPGEFCFPPIAALVTSAARLMLALLEACIAEAGGTFVCCDTDSMAVVAIETGGLVPCPGGELRSEGGKEAVLALSWEEVDEIRQRFSVLDPARSGETILKLESENYCRDSEDRKQLYCFAISAKRYRLFNELNRPELRKGSAHGLGHLLSPLPPGDPGSWIDLVWTNILEKAIGGSAVDYDWLDRPAASRISATTLLMLHAFRRYNEGKDYQEQIKPFNFLISAYVAPFGHPEGVDPTKFHLVAPWADYPAHYEQMEWYDLGSGQIQSIMTTDDLGASGKVLVKTYRTVIDQYELHPESKSLGPYGEICRGTTVGLLRRRPIVSSGRPTYIGKESNRLEEVQSGLVHTYRDAVFVYGEQGFDSWARRVLPVLRRIPVGLLAELSGLNRRTVQRLRNGGTYPRPKNKEVLTAIAETMNIERLRRT